MTPVHQDRFYDPDAPPEQQRGNCLSAVVASLMDLPLADVPNFVQDDVDHGGDDPEWNWWTRLHQWVHEHRWTLEYLNVRPDGPFRDPAPGEHYAVIGISPRDPRIHHIVIYRDGQMVHDPHPDGTGIVKVTDDFHWTLKPAPKLCPHGNAIPEGENKTSCACMIIDGAWHPCRGCHHTCGNCL